MQRSLMTIRRKVVKIKPKEYQIYLKRLLGIRQATVARLLQMTDLDWLHVSRWVPVDITGVTHAT